MTKRSRFDQPYYEWRDWAGLPRNVLFDIMDRLSVVDHYVRFGAVCRSWRAIFVEESPENTNKHCSQPFLLIPTTLAEANLYNLSAGRKYRRFSFRMGCSKEYQASSFGWLVSIKIISRENMEFYNFRLKLLNPFLSKDYTINLPLWEAGFPTKVALSSDPSLPEPFTVVVANLSRGLSFCKSGDTAWISPEKWRKPQFDVKWQVSDVIFSNRTKQFYVLYRNGQVEVIIFQEKGGEEEVELVQVMPPSTILDGGRRSWLVEDLSGGLLLVSKAYYSTPTNYDIRVYKLNLSERKWTPIHNLGDNILFLDEYGVTARSLSHCSGCQQNCIYIASYNEKEPFSSFGEPRCYAMGTFYLGNNTMQGHCLTDRPYYTNSPPLRGLLYPIWLEPTLLPIFMVSMYPCPRARSYR